jgi:signal transduction histidine kinase
MTPDTREYAEQTAALIRARLPVGVAVLLATFTIAWFMEHLAHPDRDRVYAVTLGLEALVGLTAVWASRRPGRTREQLVRLAVAAAIALVALVTAYHVVVGGEAEILALALVYLSLGMTVLVPWGGRAQLILVLSALLAYAAAIGLGIQAVTPVGLSLLGLICVSGFTVGTTVFLERYRFDVFRQAAELRRANAALVSANRAKTEFLANVSHELRTPLNVMLGYAELLRDGTFGDLAPPARDALQRMLNSAQMLLALVDDFLDLSRLESQGLGLRVEPVALAPLCREAAALIEPLLRGKPVALACEVGDDERVAADPKRLRQVFVNLLSNAAKFTHQGRIDVRAHARDGATVVEIADTGVGIPPDEQQTIFEPFQRGAHAAHISGVGIGLWLSRQLVEAMGGTVTVRSAPGRGSTFAVQLRRAVA